MDGGSVARPLPRKVYDSRFGAGFAHVSNRQHDTDATQMDRRGGGQQKEMCYDANYHECIVRNRKAAGDARQSAQTTNVDPLRTPLSKPVVYEAADGRAVAGVFRGAGDGGDCGLFGVPHREAAADQFGH